MTTIDTAIIITLTTTERRTYVQGVSLDQHKQLLAEGFTLDRLAQQYRRAKTERTLVDGNGQVRVLA